MNRYHGPCAAHTCMFVIGPCDALATKSVPIFTVSERDWTTVWLRDEHSDGYRQMADRIPGLQVRF